MNYITYIIRGPGNLTIECEDLESLEEQLERLIVTRGYNPEHLIITLHQEDPTPC